MVDKSHGRVLKDHDDDLSPSSSSSSTLTVASKIRGKKVMIK